MILYRVEHSKEPHRGRFGYLMKWGRLPNPFEDNIGHINTGVEVCACRTIPEFKLWWKKAALKQQHSNGYIIAELEVRDGLVKHGGKQVLVARRKCRVVKKHSIATFMDVHYPTKPRLLSLPHQ